MADDAVHRNRNAAAAAVTTTNAESSVVFTVCAVEDLHVSGSNATEQRVPAGARCTCAMPQSERFAALFRYYATFHGLSSTSASNKDNDLEFFFCNVLTSDDTPNSVQLLQHDTITVRAHCPVCGCC